MFDEIRAELIRLSANDVQLQTDTRLGNPDSTLVKITIGERSCIVTFTGLREMLRTLPDGSGTRGIEAAFEMRSSRAEPWVIT
jgi:hypothetical protein